MVDAVELAKRVDSKTRWSSFISKNSIDAYKKSTIGGNATLP